MFTVADESDLPKRGRNTKWGPIIDEVKKHPNVWLKLDNLVKHSAAGYSLRKYGVEVKLRASEDGWVVFVRYTPVVSE